MTRTQTSHDQIISHIWNVQALLDQGLSIEKACHEVGIQPQNYERWHREYGVQKPEYVKCEESFIQADRKNDAVQLFDLYQDYCRYREEGKTSLPVGFMLERKLALLDKVCLYCNSVDSRSHTHRGAQAWEVSPADAKQYTDQIHAIIQKEFEALLQFLVMAAKKKNKPVPSTLMTNVSIDVKGEAGSSLARDLYTVFTGRELTFKQQGQLKKDWALLSGYLQDIVTTIKGL